MARLGRLGSALVASSFVMARAAAATTYSIAVHGDDLNPGTAAQPLQTIQAAADLAQAGDTIIVEPGQYAGFAFSFGRQQTGTQLEPITFVARPGVAIVSPNAHTPDGIDVEGASWVVIDGFEVRTVPGAGIRVVSGATNSVGVTIRNNDVHDSVMWGIFTSHVDSLLIENNSVTGAQTQHGIFVSNACVSPVVRGNVLASNAGAGLYLDGDAAQGGAGVITGALVEKNVIHDNSASLMGAAGISCDGVQVSRLRNNLIYAEHGSGISLFRGDAAMPSTGNVVVNNTIVVASDGRWPLDVRGASTGNTALDNILLNSGASDGSIDVSADSLMGFTSDYNVVLDRFTLDDVTTATLDAWRAMTKQDAHSLVVPASALFVNPASNDYHLLATAVAVGGGTTTGAPADDLDGTPRLGQDDIGAYQQCCRPDAGADAASSADAGDDVPSADASRDAADARADDAREGIDDANVDARAENDAGHSKTGASSSGCACATTAHAASPDGSSLCLLAVASAIGALLLGLRRRSSRHAG